MKLLLILGLIFVAAWFIRRANPVLLRSVIRTIAGLGGLVAAAVLAGKGRFEIAFGVAVFSIGLLAGKDVDIFSIFGRKKEQKTAKEPPGDFSEVRTKYLDMRIDHDTGEMDGWVLRGPFSGQQLSRLSVTDIVMLRKDCRANDIQSIALVETYLDQVQPKWRDHPEVKAGDDPHEPQRRRNMNVDEAFEILGLHRSASDDEIRSAHRNLMKKFHPDQGGSTYLAAKINEAKDILLKRRVL